MAVSIAEGIAMLEAATVVLGKREAVCPSLVWDERDVVLIDTGYPGKHPLLLEQIAESVPSRRGAPSRILISHQDIDHIGSLPALRTLRQPPAEVFASEIEKPYIEGERRLLRLTPEAVEQAVRSLPDSVPAEMKRAFRHTLEHPPAAPVDSLLTDGQTLPFGGGIDVIATPGHTPGHMSFYHRPSRTLIAGDALTVAGGELLGPKRLPALDPETARRSLRRLADFDIAAVICHHGGRYAGGDVNRRIAELAK